LESEVGAVAGRVSQKRTKRCTTARGAAAVEWVPEAWREWVNGERSWSRLGAKHGKHRHTVRANVIRIAEFTGSRSRHRAACCGVSR